MSFDFEFVTPRTEFDPDPLYRRFEAEPDVVMSKPWPAPRFSAHGTTGFLSCLVVEWARPTRIEGETIEPVRPRWWSTGAGGMISLSATDDEWRAVSGWLERLCIDLGMGILPEDDPDTLVVTKIQDTA